ncbi:Rid family hydrolase [Aquamicrobium sp. NLF2-7]|uniref:Rid family hydrolase n=1 Tax=Aquamicrobium sp. NLF2-7 TaxID=2918753 RepID=UPI001EFB857A|nr:Rid family hydrolase [Aquamicrobium sp. NLF2-7]MCG8273949.1 Rid family hydrolase [Aquamicrobium sp. NLF2-7]
MTVEFPIERAAGVAPGRSSASCYGGLVWTVATALDKTLDLKGQIAASFEKIERMLAQFGTDKRYLLSVNVFLSDLDSKADFDVAWRQWVGDNPDHWPQRACMGAVLSPGTLVEIAVVAAKPE